MIFCYHENRFLAVCPLSEIFTYQISNFKEKIVPPMMPVQFLVRLKRNATVSSVS